MNTSHPQLDVLRHNIEPLRQKIVAHPLYAAVHNLSDLRIFMRYHVFAVWDFMSLLKALQRNLTCVELPWFPKGSADTRFLINEIVAGEESDVDEAGKRCSHYELYLRAMKQAQADTRAIESFTALLQSGKPMDFAFGEAGVPEAAQSFVSSTFRTINSEKAFLQAAVFTFGREDLIPGMFRAVVDKVFAEHRNDISVFKYYLERHIEVDGDHHSHLALAMTSDLCGDDPKLWQEAEQAVLVSLQNRIALWDGALRDIEAARS